MVMWFVHQGEAERYLTAQGFVFMGAPNRWRRIVDGVATYAIVRVSGSGASIVLRPGALDIGQDGEATTGDQRTVISTLGELPAVVRRDGLTAPAIVEAAFNDVADFAGAGVPADDDRTLVLVRR